MGSIGAGNINSFVDGQVVTANGSLNGNALNPKMQLIQTANDDNNSRIGVLEGQVASLGATQYNVKAAPYNAVGDGIVDDTTAIQAAITAASTNRGVVVFPYGTYKITNTLSITGTCVLKSTGDFSTATIKMTTSATNVISISSSNVTISDLTLDCAGSTPASTFYAITCPALYTSPISTVNVLRCKFISSASTSFRAIYLRNTNNTIIRENIVTMSASTPNAGVVIESCVGSIVENNTFTNTYGAISLFRTSGLSLTASPITANVYINRNFIVSDRGLIAIALYSVSKCYISENNITNASTGIYNISSISLYSTSDTSTTIYNKDIFILRNIIDCYQVYKTAVYADKVIGFTMAHNEIIGCATPTSANYAVTIADVDAGLIDSNLFNTIGWDTPSISNPTGGILYTGKNVTISNNTFIDMIGNSTASSGACIAFTLNSSYLLSIVNNRLVRGSATASSVNSKGLYNSNGVYNNIPVYFSGNDFSKATTFLSGAPVSFCFYSLDSTNSRVFKASNSAQYPTSGTWLAGDKTMVESPSAGGYTGYVCTTAGTSGTWKGYGTIQS